MLKNSDFLVKKFLASAKLEEPWYEKICFLKPHICVHLVTNFKFIA